MSIHIEDLTVRFKNGVTAIDHADLDIPNGIFGLLGENGARFIFSHPIKKQESTEK